jgi:hypothetical protein
LRPARVPRLATLAAGAILLSGATAAAAAVPGGGFAIPTLLAQDAGGGGDKDGSKNTDVSELWELYPIDPADAGTPLPTPEPAATDASGTVINPAAEEPLRKVQGPPVAGGEDVPIEGDGGVPAEAGGDEPSGDRPWSPAIWAPWLALGAVVLVFAGGGAALAARRPHRTQGGVGVAAITQGQAARTSPPVAGPAAQAGDATRGASSREHVRIHLLDGRRIEGWKKSGWVSQDNRVIVLDVDNVYDSSGKRIASTPLDSFVLPPQVDHIESLD